MDIEIAQAFIEGYSIGFDPEEKTFKIVAKAKKVALKILNPSLTIDNPLSKNFLEGLSQAYDKENLDWLEISSSLVEKLSSLENPEAMSTRMKIILAQTLYETVHPLLDASTPQFLRADSDYVSRSVEQQGNLLRFADLSLKNTPSVIDKAVTQDGLSLRYATEEMRSNIDLCRKAILQNPLAIKFAYGIARHDRELAKLAVSLEPKALIYTTVFDNDPVFLMECISQNLKVFLNIDESLRTDPDFQKKVLDLFEGHAGLKDTIMSYNHKEIRTLLVSKLIEISELAFSAEGKKILKNTGIPESFTTLEISPLFTKIICQSWNATEDDLSKIDSFIKISFFKDGKKRQALLYVLKNINECKLNNEQKLHLFMNVLGTTEAAQPEKEELLERLIIFALNTKLLKPEELLTIEDFSSKNLKELMLKELIEKGFLEKDKVESFLHLVNHSRMPSALFAYIKNFIDNESMKTIIAVFIKSLIEKTFAKLRHENNSYKELLSEEQIRLWQTDKCMKFDATHQVFDSENWEDLFLCGTEVLSCQRVDGFVDYNKCLMGYVCDGKVRILCLKDHEGGPIKARCMLKIVKIGDGSPCLLLEKLYPEHRQEDYVFFKRCALSIAGGLKMPVFEGSELATGLIVYSDKKNPALWEYSDSGSGITDGTYEAKVRVLEP